MACIFGLASESQLTPRLLDRRSVDKAYPVIRDVIPNISLNRWVEFTRPYLTARSRTWPRGLMTIQNSKYYILGLFGFEVRSELHESRTLFLDNIIVPQIPGHDLIWASVLRSAEVLATINNCHAIQIGLSDDINLSEGDRDWLSVSLAKAGYAIAGIRAFKRAKFNSHAYD